MRSANAGTRTQRKNAAVNASAASIVSDLEDQSYGDRRYIAEDPEGHLWNFGTYDPWA